MAFTANGGEFVDTELRAIAAIEVPAGTYLFTGVAGIGSVQPGDDLLGQCQLVTPEGSIAFQRADAPGRLFDGENGQRLGTKSVIALTKVAATRGGSVTLSCRKLAGRTTLNVSPATVNAVPVAPLRS